MTELGSELLVHRDRFGQSSSPDALRHRDQSPPCREGIGAAKPATPPPSAGRAPGATESLATQGLGTNTVESPSSCLAYQSVPHRFLHRCCRHTVEAWILPRTVVRVAVLVVGFGGRLMGSRPGGRKTSQTEGRLRDQGGPILCWLSAGGCDLDCKAALHFR
jgi:hypothetical protein